MVTTVEVAYQSAYSYQLEVSTICQNPVWTTVSNMILSYLQLFGSTILHVAARNGHVPLVALLLATPGVDPLRRDHVRLL